MGAKKGKKGKKGKKKKGGVADTYEPTELAHVHHCVLDSLQVKYADISERAQSARAGENEKRYKDLEMTKFEQDAKKTSNDIMADMTRQYKSTQEELTNTEKNLNQRVRENDKAIEVLEKDYETLKNLKEKTEKEKDD